MTKNLHVELIDHIGLDLWRAAKSWKQLLTDQMVAAGDEWYAGAPGMLTMHIGPNGISQSKLQDRAQLSKQAVQQLLDKLEQDGVIERAPHPTDKRAKLVRFTKVGLSALLLANRIKQQIEQDYREALGEDQFATLQAALKKLNAMNDA